MGVMMEAFMYHTSLSVAGEVKRWRQTRDEDRCHYQGAVLTKTTSTPTRGREQPGAGFEPLRGVTRLQPYLRGLVTWPTPVKASFGKGQFS